MSSAISTQPNRSGGSNGSGRTRDKRDPKGKRIRNLEAFL
ncbi:LOW QUALITY PROTEIN: hypothetical protein PanWU01x14_012050 [Parasponia andersonii]|uniref:Uncharacterized protein n=1 Tax=Parasponia andersonii TaxID=3476 RepID=A0A2P5E1P7_PARAD|nr:LOW QUALITY PROTEIN: hypothetical protein PanWU01x14_012050 [Parasponia andersonii]